MTHRLFFPILTGLVLALLLGSVRAGLFLDDYVLLAILSGPDSLSHLYPSRLDIFNFFDGSPERMRRMLDLGLLPWWTFPGTRIAFWRPVSALTHWLDYTAWRDLPVLMHIQSLVWFGGLIAAVQLMYRRLLGPGCAAGIATLLYVVDRSHAYAVTFVAGRNAILGALFGTLALLFHDRWRRGGWRPGSLVAPACLALALLSAEKAVATGAYLAAHAVFLDHGGWRRRLMGLAPYALVVGTWLLVYTGLGYGVFGVAPGYSNPLREPLHFAHAVAKNGPILLSAQWIGPRAEGFSQLPPGAAAARWVVALLILAVLAALLAPLLRRDPLARFWSLGQVLAVVPACAAAPHEFYLNFVALGAMGLLATFLGGLVDQEAWRPAGLLWKWPAALLAGILLLVHLVASPLELARGANRVFDYSSMERASDSIPTDEAIRRQLVVIVNAPSAVVVAYSFFIRAVKGQPIPGQTRLLASGEIPLTIFRPDTRTLNVRWEGRQQRMFRADEHPIAPHQRVRLSRTEIEVTAVTDGWPKEAIFRFDTDLEDPALRWLRWASENGHGRFVAFRPPSVGETVLVR
jgi:hypothetical protein